MNKIALIDLDTPCYASAAAVEERSILVTHEPSGKEKVFKNRTEFKHHMIDRKIKYEASDYIITDIQSDPEPSHAIQILKNQLNRIIDAIQPDEVVYMISGKSNFRDELRLPKKYKGNRDNSIKPVVLNKVKKYAIKTYNPIVSENEEPDDIQVWLGYEYLKEGCIPIGVTIDKDFLAYSGLWHYNQNKPEEGISELPVVGYLYPEGNKVKGRGFIWYAYQALRGDDVDGYKPTHLSKLRIGDMGIYNALKDCRSHKEILNTVIRMYQSWYPETFWYEDWKGMMIETDYRGMIDLYHKCCRMKEIRNDPLDAVEFYDRYGVTL